MQALYCNILTGLCSPEEACRLTWFAHRLCREQGIPYRSGMISDVPTQGSATLPMILAAAGIRYFSAGINADRAFPFVQLQQKSPCWWEGPDGSRILMVFSPGYGRAYAWGLTGFSNGRGSACWRTWRQFEGRAIIPTTRSFCTGPSMTTSRIDARLAEHRPPVEPALRISQAHSLHERRVLRVHREALRRPAAGLSRSAAEPIGRTAPPPRPARQP